MSYSWTREGLEADLEGYVDPRVKRNEKITYLVCDDLKKDNPELSFAPYLGQETFSFYIAATLNPKPEKIWKKLKTLRVKFLP